MAGDIESDRIRTRRSLGWAFGLVASFMVVELVVGLVVDSLAILSDAAHMATDALALGMALAAAVAADRYAASDRHTFGLYRLEILAALGNALLLLGVAGFVVWEAIDRIGDAPDVAAAPLAIIGVAGFGVNVVAWALLRRGPRSSLNAAAASLEVLADLFASVAVIVAAAAIGIFGWHWVDALVALLIAAYIAPRAVKLGFAALRVLIQAAPGHIDLELVREALLAIPGAVDVHDVHVWTLTSDMEVASIHVMVGPDEDTHAVLDTAARILRDDFSIAHATLQVEPESHAACAETSW